MALTTLSRVKTDLGILSTSTEFDALLTTYIDVASNQIEILTNRIFTSASYTSYLNGKRNSYVIVEQFPVTALTSVYQDNTWGFGVSKQIPNDTEVKVYKEVFLIRRGRCNYFEADPAALKVEYTAGYSTIPEAIQQACVEMVRYLYLSSTNKRMGMTNRSKYAESTGFDNDVPPIIDFLLTPWKRENAIKRAFQLDGYMLNLNGTEISKESK